MAGRLGAYAIAAAMPAAIGIAGLGPLRCGEYGTCGGGANWTPQTLLLGAVIGAVIGLAVAALIDVVYNGRYLLANRAEAKAQRQRDENRRDPTHPLNDGSRRDHVPPPD